MSTELDVLKQEVNDLKEMVEMLQSEIQSRDEEINQIKANLQKKDQEIGSLKIKVTDQDSHNSQIDQYQGEINILQQQLSELKNQIDDKNLEIEILKHDHNEELNNLINQKKQLLENNQIDNQIVKLQNIISQLQQDKNDQLIQHNKEIDQLKQKIEDQSNQKLLLSSQNIEYKNNDNLQQSDEVKYQINEISQLQCSVVQQLIHDEDDQQLEGEFDEFRLNQSNQLDNIGTLLNPMESPRLDQNSQDNEEELEQMQNTIIDFQKENEASKVKIELLCEEIKQLKQQINNLSQINQGLQLDLEQKKNLIKEEQKKLLQLEHELITYEQKYEDVIQIKQKLYIESQLAQQSIQQFEMFQQDNIQLQQLLDQKSQELEEFKQHNQFETQYQEQKENFDQFKEYVQVQFRLKDEAFTQQAQQLLDFDTCKEQLLMLSQQYQFLQEQLNKQKEHNEQLQDQYDTSLQQLNTNNQLQSNIQSQNLLLQQEIETIKLDNLQKLTIIKDLETQLKIQQQQFFEESQLKFQKLQLEFFEKENEYINHKEQNQREIYQYKQDNILLLQDLQNTKDMINQFISQNKQYQPKGKFIEEQYNKLLNFSVDNKFEQQEEEFIQLKQQLELIQIKTFSDQQWQINPQLNEQETLTNQIELLEKQIQTEQIGSNLSGSMWLNNDTINSKEDQYQQIKKKNEDLDKLLKNYEKEVSNLKQQNKLLQKKLESNQKSNPQERLGKRVSLFEQSQPRKSKQLHLNLCESYQIDDQQRENLFMKELIENLKKENKQLSLQNDDLQLQLNEIKLLQEKNQEEQNRLEEQLQSQILLNQTRNKSIDNNQTIISQFNNTMIQLNQIEIFLVVKSIKNFQFPYMEFNRKQIKFYSQGKTRIEKQIYETFIFDDIFLDIQKVRQYFQFYGKITLDQSRMFLIVGQKKTQKKFLLLMFLDLYYNSIKEQQLQQNQKVRLQIQYQERIGNNWSTLDQLSSDLLIENENLDSSLQQLDLKIQNIKFYLYGQNLKTKILGKEKIRLLTITYSIIIKEQTYTQQFIITTIPIVPRCQFTKFLKRICNHTATTQFKYCCLLTVNPILLHYNQTVDIMYLAKMVYSQNNQEDLNKQMKIDDESVRQVRQANGQVILKNQEIDTLKLQVEYFKKQYHEILIKQESKLQLYQQVQIQLQSIVVDIKQKISQSKNHKNTKMNCSESQFYEKLIAQLENLSRKLTPIQQVLFTDRSISPQRQNQ